MSYVELEIVNVKKSRKIYQCVWCATTISLGESYVSRKYVYDGKIDRDRWHSVCWDASGNCKDDLCDGFSAGDYPRGGSIAFGDLDRCN